MYNLENEIKKRLDRLNWSIEKLASMAGTTRVTLHRVFNTNDAKLSLLTQIAHAFEEPVSAFIGERQHEDVKVPIHPRVASGKSSDHLAMMEIKTHFQQQLLEAKDKQIQMLEQEVTRLRAEMGRVNGDRNTRQTG